jgi:hypothetical protein
VKGLDDIEQLSELRSGATDRFMLRTFMGGSSTIVIDRPGSGDEKVHIETIKHAGIIYLQLIEERERDGETTILSYRLSGPDGAAAPAWLRQIGPFTFAGQPDAGTGTVDLILSISQSDGQVFEHEIRLDSFTGHLSRPDLPKDDRSQGRPPPMFAEQMNRLAPTESTARLEQALGLR